MNALKENYEKVLFILALAVFGWSAYSVFSKLGSFEVVDAADITPIEAGKVTNAVYDAYTASLNNRFQASDASKHVGFVSEKRFECTNPTNCFRYLEYVDHVGSITCSYCGTETNPDPPDRDGDGMSNDYEVAHGLDAYNDDAEGDLDADGFWNVVEHDAGTKPNDPLDHPSLLPFLFATNTVNDPMPIVMIRANKLGAGKYMIQLQDLRSRRKESVKLGDDYTEFKLVEFEENVVAAHMGKNQQGKDVFVPKQDRSVLTVLNKAKNRTYKLPMLRRGGADWTAEIRSSIDSNFVARVDMNARTNFTFRSQEFTVLDIARLSVTVQEPGQDGEQKTLGTQAELLDPNTRAPSGFFPGSEDGGLYEGMDMSDPEVRKMMQFYESGGTFNVPPGSSSQPMPGKPPPRRR